ncbi:ATP-dependent DNA helicase RecQ [Frondihabitans sp. PhB188]|uniref:RecQ family ATP-dependent DNA helicase n=1 Tax=Frondihabitans sp. PhB188 TaxID=2485200 RepID=UPI000F497DDF|nr:RecQ family ATP-dependent DNA helicase [Frondihabitans sp. PhB188]ROQ40707.1 ATP-dependent DNA helicase RecQ [Frondihabitans sp. PhB188]
MSTTLTHDIARTAADRFGWDDLRPPQEKAITAILEGRDVLAVMPTGYGKSAIYQVAGALLDGPTIVVSPLIALQADQVAGLSEKPDAPVAVSINSGHTAAENEESWQRLARGDATYVFVAPEQLADDEAVERLSTAGVALVVVDEAHCVSTWGHDFRPDYLHLGEIAERLGRPPVLALTATGSGPIRDDIGQRLGLRDPALFSHGFDRPNLHLEVVRHEDDDEKVRAVEDQLASAEMPAIVYVATRRETGTYPTSISEARPELAVIGYHGGHRSAERGEAHERFSAGAVDVVVATSAFGLGIDKPDIRSVIHADVPDSLDEYYQEIGRAGRDGEPSTATLHYRPEDLSLRTFFVSGLPPRDQLRDVFTVVSVAGGPVRRSAVADQVALKRRTVSRLLDLLHEAGAVTESAKGVAAAAGFDPKGAAEAARGIAATRERVEKSRIAMMRGYAETTRCRRRYLLGYFGQDAPERCGNCDNCDRSTESVEQVESSDDAVASSNDAVETSGDAFPADTTVVHDAWGTGTVMSNDEGRVTVFFESEGYKVLDTEEVLKRELLHISPGHQTAAAR